MIPIFIVAKTIPDAWLQLICSVFNDTYKQKIQKGSFGNEQHRLQYSGVMIYIEHPYYDMVPIMPPNSNIPPPTTKEFIEDYFVNYLMNPELVGDETYKYASRIHSRMPKGGTQLERVIEMLKQTPLTNQATIEVATPDDLDICYGKNGRSDPPCLRLIDFKVIPTDKLILTVSAYFRSWDLWSGLPTNLGGLELLKQLVAQETSLENGPMYVYSAGAHIYGYQEEIVKIRTLRGWTQPKQY